MAPGQKIALASLPVRLLAILVLGVVHVRVDRPIDAPGGGGGASDTLESLILRTEALQHAVSRLRLDADALAGDAGACTTEQAHGAQGLQRFDMETGGAAGADQNGDPVHETSDVLGLRMIQPLDGEVLHTNMAVYRFETFLPPHGDVSFSITLDGRSTQDQSLCSWSCAEEHKEQETNKGPGKVRPGCVCKCSGTCDCATCRRTSYSEVARLVPPRGILSPGIHSLIVQIDAVKGTGSERNQTSTFKVESDGPGRYARNVRMAVQSHFKVVKTWTSAFPALTGSSEVWEGWRGVVAPRFAMAGLQYSMTPHQASGAGALWPGLSIHRPHPGEIFDVYEGVTFDIEIFDFDVLPTRCAYPLSLQACLLFGRSWYWR